MSRIEPSELSSPRLLSEDEGNAYRVGTGTPTHVFARLKALNQGLILEHGIATH